MNLRYTKLSDPSTMMSMVFVPFIELYGAIYTPAYMDDCAHLQGLTQYVLRADLFCWYKDDVFLFSPMDLDTVMTATITVPAKRQWPLRVIGIYHYHGLERARQFAVKYAIEISQIIFTE